jgi:hypothetical protein
MEEESYFKVHLPGGRTVDIMTTQGADDFIGSGARPSSNPILLKPERREIDWQKATLPIKKVVVFKALLFLYIFC